MDKLFNKGLVFGLGIVGVIACTQTTALAKIRKPTLFQPKRLEASSIKGVSGEASITVLKKITLLEKSEFQFQDGKITESLEYYKSPRCYLHFKNDVKNQQELSPGELKISKIDNIYANGSVHVTFWFDHDPAISDLACVTNYNHTLTVEELKETLGADFAVSLPKSVEKAALFNTAPVKNAKALSEDTTNNTGTHSTRVILSGS